MRKRAVLCFHQSLTRSEGCNSRPQCVCSLTCCWVLGPIQTPHPVDWALTHINEEGTCPGNLELTYKHANTHLQFSLHVFSRSSIEIPTHEVRLSFRERTKSGEGYPSFTVCLSPKGNKVTNRDGCVGSLLFRRLWR